MKVDFEAKLLDIRHGQSRVSDRYLLENIIARVFSSESTYLNSAGYNFFFTTFM